MAPFGPEPAMVGNEMSFNRPVSRRKLSSASTAPISVSLPFGASPSSQARKRAGDFGTVLHRFHWRDRVGATQRLAAAVRHQTRERVGGAGAVEPHVLVFQLAEVAL